jgi:hypothetical protein
MKTISANCPSCGAPLEDLTVGTVECVHCGRAIRFSRSGTLEVESASPHPSGPPTLGERLWERVRPYSRTGVTGLAILLAAGAGLIIRTFFAFTEGSRYGDESIMSAILLGIAGLLLRGTGRTASAVLVPAVGGVLLVAKPLIYPMWSVYGGERSLFSLNSETHLNFFVPGGMLLVLALVIALTLRPRTSEQAAVR